MPCSSSIDSRMPRMLYRACCCCIALLMLLCLQNLAANEDVSGNSVLQQVQWELHDGHVEVNAAMVLVFSEPMLDALQQGIPVHFVASAELVRKRWWLLERVDARANRYWRLSYQPLTRLWRLQLSQSESDLANQGFAQTFDSLTDAIAVMQRINGWQITPVTGLREGVTYQAEFSFGVNTSLLPRPLNFDALGRADWGLELESRSALELR